MFISTLNLVEYIKLSPFQIIKCAPCFMFWLPVAFIQKSTNSFKIDAGDFEKNLTKYEEQTFLNGMRWTSED